MIRIVPRLLGRVARASYGAGVIAVVMLTLWLVTVFVRRPRAAIALQRAASRMLACLGCRISVVGGRPAGGLSACMFVATRFIEGHALGNSSDTGSAR